jgi:hypothetical protein
MVAGPAAVDLGRSWQWLRGPDLAYAERNFLAAPENEALLISYAVEPQMRQWIA